MNKKNRKKRLWCRCTTGCRGNRCGCVQEFRLCSESCECYGICANGNGHCAAFVNIFVAIFLWIVLAYIFEIFVATFIWIVLCIVIFSNSFRGRPVVTRPVVTSDPYPPDFSSSSTSRSYQSSPPQPFTINIWNFFFPERYTYSAS